MVHVKKCPLADGRGKPSTEFYVDGKPQIYCMGWVYKENEDVPIEECRNCKDWYMGDQVQIDFENMKKKESEDD